MISTGTFNLAPIYNLLPHRIIRRMLVTTLSSVLLVPLAASAQTPSVGAQAPDFTLSTTTGDAIRLSNLTKDSTVVLVVLRGYPGYQCPFCEKQVHDFVAHSAAFAAKQSTVLLVYPGPPADLDAHAKEFLATQANLPSNVKLVVDPDYAVTNLYGLRWDAPHETAYPSTFILKRKGTVAFSKVSHSHGDRISAEETLTHIDAQ